MDALLQKSASASSAVAWVIEERAILAVITIMILVTISNTSSSSN